MGPWFTFLAAAVSFAALVAAFVCGVMFERGRLGRKQASPRRGRVVDGSYIGDRVPPARRRDR
jgi:hypothetical protein